mgnify:FL=1
MAGEIKNYTPDLSTNSAEGLTQEVGEFVLNTAFSTLSADLLDLGRKSMLDGFGLALSGSVAVSGHIVPRYLIWQGVSG